MLVDDRGLGLLLRRPLDDRRDRRALRDPRALREWRMNAQDERNLHLRARLETTALRGSPRSSTTPWRTYGVIAQCVFFVLTCVGLGAFYGLLHVVDVPRAGLVTGVAAIVARRGI